jgi:Aminoglycoside/hydroxyurea antibiotic resistance kinase
VPGVAKSAGSRLRLGYRRGMGSDVPGIDAGTRQRLTARFGGQAEAWFGELPGVLAAVAQRWQLAVGSPIPRGSVSAVYWCRMADGRRAVLKASPDRARLAFEAAAVGAWHTVRTPAVIALDGQLGVLLLARDDSRVVLLHGDLTPGNILDGGAGRGLVAIDPAPCLGDPAFDAVDLILLQAEDLQTIQARTGQLAAAGGVDAGRLLGWCTAFAAMSALERASQRDGRRAGIQALLELASQA